MDKETHEAVAVLIATPLLDLVQIKVLRVAAKRVLNKDLSFGDAYFGMWALRVIAGELGTGLRSQSERAADFKDAATTLSKYWAKRKGADVPDPDVPNLRDRRVFLG